MALKDGELCLCQPIDLLELAPSTISKHMALLLQAGLIEKRKEGRWHFYRLAGNDGTKETQVPLAWMFKSLETEGTIRKDAEMMSRVREKGLVAPCVYYRS
jgi:ArsR family transcriptional regulator